MGACHGPQCRYPYYADQYAKDVRDWVVATEVPEHRQGQLLIFAMGGAARRFLDGMTAREKHCGIELADAQGRVVRVSVVEFTLGVLEAQLPVHEETRVLHTGLDFFKFMQRRGERLEEWFKRVDEMLGEANRVAHLGLSVTFPSWMLLSLLQLSPKKCSELFEDLQRRLLRDRAEHIGLQQAILREKVLENSIFDIRSHARNVAGAGGSRGGGSCCSNGGAAEPRPLYMCPGDPGGHEPRADPGTGAAGKVPVEVHDGHYLIVTTPTRNVAAMTASGALMTCMAPLAQKNSESTRVALSQ